MARTHLPNDCRGRERIPVGDGVLAIHLDSEGKIVYGRIVEIGPQEMSFEFRSGGTMEPEDGLQVKGMADIVSLRQDLLITDLPVAGVADFQSSDPFSPGVPLCRRHLKFGALTPEQTEAIREFLLLSRSGQAADTQREGEHFAEPVLERGAAMKEPCKILLVEDHEVLRKGLIDLFDDWPEFKVVAEAGDGEEALRACERQTPDVVVLDLGMPKLGGMEALRQMKRRWPQMSILILTMHQNRQMLHDAMEAGATAYCLKDVPLEELQAALHAAAQGEEYVSRGMGWRGGGGALPLDDRGRPSRGEA